MSDGNRLLIRPALLARVVVSLAGALTAVGLVVYWARLARIDRDASGCRGNLGQIGFAVRAYADRYGSLPPAVVTDADGRVMHSWRALILPFMGFGPEWMDYEFDEPWNSPHNSMVTSSPRWRGIVSAFVCPCRRDDGGGCTSYVAIVGDDTFWPKASPAEVTDQDAHESPDSILIIEVPDANILTFEPRDVSAAELFSVLGHNKTAGHGVQGDIVYGYCVDRHVHAISLRHDLPTVESRVRKRTIRSRAGPQK